MLSILRVSQFECQTRKLMLILKIKKNKWSLRVKISFSLFIDQGVVFKLLQNFHSILCHYIWIDVVTINYILSWLKGSFTIMAAGQNSRQAHSFQTFHKPCNLNFFCFIVRRYEKPASFTWSRVEQWNAKQKEHLMFSSITAKQRVLGNEYTKVRREWWLL